MFWLTCVCRDKYGWYANCPYVSFSILLPLAQLENVTTSHFKKSSDLTTNMAGNCPDDSLTIPRLALRIVLTSRHEYPALLFLTWLENVMRCQKSLKPGLFNEPSGRFPAMFVAKPLD